jgi:hypothetical protein
MPLFKIHLPVRGKDDCRGTRIFLGVPLSVHLARLLLELAE